MAALDPSALLCPCGVRGCDFYEQHMQAFIQIPKTRRHRGGSKRPRLGRR